MATTASGWSYAVPNDTLVAWPAVSQAVADKLETNIANYAPGLALIKTQTIGTAVSSVTVTNAFSSTYDNYKIIINGGVGSTTSSISIQIGAAATAYYGGLAQVPYSTGTVGGLADNNATKFTYCGYMTPTILSSNVEILAPYLSKPTNISTTYAAQSTTGSVASYAGFLNNSTSYTDLTVLPITGNMTGGTIYVYGYRKTI